MNKVILVTIIMTSLLLFTASSNALIIKEYGHITFDTTELVNSIPQEYYQGMKYVKFFEKDHSEIWGQYWLHNGIDIFDSNRDSVRRTLIHEVAHNCQIQRGDNIYLALNHTGNFTECLNELNNLTTWKP